jgi:hypothetical protein
MKCGSLLVYKLRKKRRSEERVPYLAERYSPQAISHWTLVHPGFMDRILDGAAETKTCEGKIVATVEAGEEPYYGGCSPTVEVEYKCDSCSNAHFPELPDPGSLGSWLTAIIAELPAEHPLLELTADRKLHPSIPRALFNHVCTGPACGKSDRYLDFVGGRPVCTLCELAKKKYEIVRKPGT